MAVTQNDLHDRAPAKINLFLHVLGARASGAFRGYHEIDSLFAFVDLHDVLTVAPGDGLRLTISGPFAGGLTTQTTDLGSDNLVLRAARALARECGTQKGAHLVLEKNLPVAAGLGGGSSDAAAALHLLSRFWKLGVNAQDLAALALDLGADVPACLQAQTCRVGGIGEVVTPVGSLPACGVVLVNARQAVSTAEVFALLKSRAPNDQKIPPARWPVPLDSFAALCAWLAACRNDLQESAIALCPDIKTVIAALEALPAVRLVRMSGSGASVFALFDDKQTAQRAADDLACQHPAWWVQATSLL